MKKKQCKYLVVIKRGSRSIGQDQYFSIDENLTTLKWFDTQSKPNWSMMGGNRVHSYYFIIIMTIEVPPPPSFSRLALIKG